MKETKQDIVLKRSLLKETEKQLKKEFVGIDNVIEQIINSVSSWYSFPYFQERPTIINLWGLTGTGKSSVILRLAELLQVMDKFYHFELSQNEPGYRSGIRSKLEGLYEVHTGLPMILVLDEFQHMRTIDGLGLETNSFTQGIIWQLLDSGRFEYSDFPTDLPTVAEAISILQRALQIGVLVKNGIVTAKIKEFKKLIDDRFFDEDDHYFVNTDVVNAIYCLNKAKYTTEFDVRMELSKLNGYQTIAFLNEVVKEALKPKIVDCSKALIFVIGNLDEAFKMSSDFSADIDADDFYKQSLKITVPIIKKSLQLRFRSEQIARLGNTHIIYPALNKKSYQQFIDLQLHNLKRKVKRAYNIDMIFDESVNTLIYEEAVYPTQGTRPIFSSIHQILYPLIANIIAESIILEGFSKPVPVTISKNNIRATLIDKGRNIQTLSNKLELTLNVLRKPKKDDKQSIVAVHEAGHTVLSIILMNIIPDKVVSVSTDPDNNGFTQLSLADQYPKNLFVKHIAMLLGGFLAEELVYGSENVTTGASIDLLQATQLATAYIKQHGFGKNMGVIATPSPFTDNYVFDINNQNNSQVISLIDEAKQLAIDTLSNNYNFLLKLSEYLCTKPVMNNELLTQYCKQYISGFEANNYVNTKKIFYRTLLNIEISKQFDKKSDLHLVASSPQV